MVADSALYFRLELSIEQVNEDTPLSLNEPVPEVLRHNLVRSIIRVFLFNIRFLADLVAVFVHGL